LDRDEAYCAEALNFHLGLLEACAGRPEAMAEHIRLSHTMPCPEDEHLFSDHVTICMITREHQLDAIARKIPATGGSGSRISARRETCLPGGRP
jgi:hypothetical protein